MIRLDLATGRLGGRPATSSRTLRELRGLFADQEALAAADLDQVVYETHGSANQDDLDPPALLAATTVLHPGRVGNEPFMTRGHFHLRPERGETCLVLRGTGRLLLVDRDGTATEEAMSPGSLHQIDGRLAHRVVNDGAEPLVFFVVWMSDCGHDYGAAFPRVAVP